MRTLRPALLALLLVACTPALAARADTLGYVQWDCKDPKPRAWIREDILGTHQEAGIRAHERSHVAVILAVSGGDCRVWQGWRMSKTNRLALEALGYCAQVKAEVPRLWPDVAAGAAHYAGWLAHPYYGFGITKGQAAELIALACEQ